MAKSTPGWKQKLIAALISCSLIAILLLLGEVYCRAFTRINFLDNSRGLFTDKRYGNSYGNTPNFEGVSFGERSVTDAEGMRIDPEFADSRSEKTNALLIMGDSVAFGPALKDNETIAGNLRRWMPSTKILNGSVIGYDTFDYKAATLAHVQNHPEVRSVALFMCLNDISNASAQLIRSQNGQPTETVAETTSVVRSLNDFLRSRSKLYLWLKNALVDTEMYYFKYDLASYQRGEENAASALQPVIELDRELRPRGISLRVFVLPYEAQLRGGGLEDSDLPQRMIGSALAKYNVEHYDLMEDFKATGKGKQLFLYGDPMHLSSEGTRLTASFACKKLEGCNIP